MMKRVVIHEALHNVLTRYHDSQSTSYTVMQDTTPAATAAGWTSLNYLVCDGAAAQLEYDVKYLSSPYADCFDHIANHGTNGLKTKLNVAGLPLAQCTGDPVVFSGTLSVGNDTTNYKQLSGNPLGLRTVWLERAPVGSSSFTTIASTTTHSSGGTYSFSVTYYSAQSWAFRVRFNEQAGLDGRYSTETLTASWASQCPL